MNILLSIYILFASLFGFFFSAKIVQHTSQSIGYDCDYQNLIKNDLNDQKQKNYIKIENDNYGHSPKVYYTPTSGKHGGKDFTKASLFSTGIEYAPEDSIVYQTKKHPLNNLLRHSIEKITIKTDHPELWPEETIYINPYSLQDRDYIETHAIIVSESKLREVSENIVFQIPPMLRHNNKTINIFFLIEYGIAKLARDGDSFYVVPETYETESLPIKIKYDERKFIKLKIAKRELNLEQSSHTKRLILSSFLITVCLFIFLYLDYSGYFNLSLLVLSGMFIVPYVTENIYNVVMLNCYNNYHLLNIWHILSYFLLSNFWGYMFFLMLAHIINKSSRLEISRSHPITNLF